MCDCQGIGLPASSVLGAGGGGGMQFANGYVFQNRHYIGLGLGTGVGSTEATVQYSYNDYPASGRPPVLVHQYNPAVIAEYQTQLTNLKQQLRSRYGSGKTS
jgi:alkylation response protein AidB-like acyl-CoA dehydrogenase